MNLAPAVPIEERFSAMAAAIRRLIPAAEVRLYSCGEASGQGSWARGEAGPDSDDDDEPEELGLDRVAWCQRAEALIEHVQDLHDG